MFDWLWVLLSRIHGLVLGRRLDGEFDHEIHEHLTMLAEENERRGMSPEEAMRQARLKFGGVNQVRESRRDKQGLPQIDIAVRDLRYAWRVLAKSPAFTAVAVTTLALGIGVNTTLFTAFNAVALKPLPVKDSGRVVRFERWFENGSQGNGQYMFSYPEYTYYRDHARTFSALIAASWPVRAFAELPDGPETVQVQLVSENYFAGLGVSAALGRTFLPEENRTPGANPLIVLSYPFWRRQFNSDVGVVGKTVTVNGTAFTVIGVASQDFIGSGNPPQVPDSWAPAMMQAQLQPGQDWINEPGTHGVEILGRLNGGVTRAKAQAEVNLLGSQLSRAFPEKDRTIGLTIELATLFGETNDIRFQEFAALLMAVVGLVLLIACANLANMLLARAAGRQKEIGVRLALGAGRGRLIQQLLTESLLLGLMGGMAGLLLSIWASRGLWAFLEQTIQAFLQSRSALTVPVTPDIRVFAYTLLLSLVTSVVFGLAPALQSSKIDLAAAIKDEPGVLGHQLRRSRLRGFLVAVQVAVSMILLVAAGLLLRGLARSRGIDTGYDTRTAFMVLFNHGANGIMLQQRGMERLRTLPGVKGVAAVDNFPMGGTRTPPVVVEGSSASAASVPRRTLANRVSPEYFDTLGVPIVYGRNFTREESDRMAAVAVISESAARRFWPGLNPIGRRFKLDLNFRNKYSEFEVIGVAKDVRTAQISRVDPAFVYLTNSPVVRLSDTTVQLSNILIRTQGDTKNALAAVRAMFETLDRRVLPSVSLVSLEDGPLQLQRLLVQVGAWFALALAGLALALASVGIYGVMSYLVSQRVKEIGIHMALGATSSELCKLFIRGGLRPVFVGAGVGLAGAAAVSAILRATLAFPGTPDMLFGANPLDPIVLLGLTVFLALVASLASYLPVRRALRVDPTVVLRYE